MNWGVFRIDETRDDNGVLGDGFASWVTGSKVTLTHLGSTELLAERKAAELSAKEPNITFFVAKTWRGNI